MRICEKSEQIEKWVFLNELSFFLLEWTFLQSFGKSDVTPVFTLPILACWDFHPLLFSFTSCISTPWHFVKTFRILLRYWGLYFRFLMSFIFQRRFQSFHRVYFVLMTFSEGGLMLVFSVFSAISDRDIYLSTLFLRVLFRLTVYN